MKNKYNSKKKGWEKPQLKKLQFKDTFSGTYQGKNEHAATSYS